MRTVPRLLILAAAALLLAGCFAGVQPTLPALRPPAVGTASERTVELPSLSVPTATPPSQTPTPHRPPTATPAVPTPLPPAPAEITYHNAVQLQPAAIFPLFRRGLLRSVRWSPDGGSLVVETSQGMQVLAADGLGKRYGLADISPVQFMEDNDLLVRSAEGLAYLDLSEGGLSPVLDAAGAPLSLPPPGAGADAFALSPDGAYWATAPDGLAVQVQPLASGEPVQIMLTSQTRIALAIRRLAFSADSQRLYALADRADGLTELMSIQIPADPAAEGWLPLHTVYGASTLPFFSPSGELMAVENGERLDVLFTADGQPWAELSRRIVRDLNAQTQSILTTQAVSFLPDGKQVGVLYNGAISDLLTHRDSAMPATLIIYNTGAPAVARTINNLPAWVLDFAFSPDGTAFLTTSRDGMLRLWDTASGGLLFETSEPYDTDASPAVRADGRLAAYARVEAIALVDPATGQQTATLGDYPGAQTLEARFAGQNTLAVFVELPSYQFIDLFNIATGQLDRRITGLNGDCQFNRGGNLMACFDGIYKFVDLSTGQIVLDIVPQGSGAEYAMSADGQQVAACTRGAEIIYLYTTRPGARPAALSGERLGACGNLVFSPAGDRLASSAGLVWDTASRALLATFSPSSGQPLAINTAGDLLVLFPELIDLSNGEAVGALQSVPEPRELFFQPDGAGVVLITRRGIEFWNVAPAATP